MVMWSHIFTTFQSIDYDERASVILDIIEKRSKSYPEQKRPSVIRDMSRHMLEWLVNECSLASFREAEAFSRIIINIFPKKTAKRYDMVRVLNDRISDLTDYGTEESCRRAKAICQLGRETLPNRAHEIMEPVMSGGKRA